jgi:uncharacterized protein (DUF1501 family)
MERREFLKHVAAGTLGVGSTLGGGPGALLAAQRQRKSVKAARPLSNVEKPVLIVIYLRGGQDQLNAIIPYRDKTYYDIRPTIAVPADKVVRLDDQWGLHPAMAPLEPFYHERRITAVVNCGSPHPTRSHFDAQDFMEFAAPGYRTVRDGWLNRYLQATAKAKDSDAGQLRALAMQELLPRSLRGQFPVVTVPGNLREIDEVLDLFEDFYANGDPDKLADTITKAETIQKKTVRPSRSGSKDKTASVWVDPVMATGRETIEGLRRLRQLLFGDNRESDRDDQEESGYPNDWFARHLRAAARVIKADVGLEVVGFDVNGWDHHIGMGSIDGTMNRMLGSLSAGLAAFMRDLGPHLDRTLIMMCTEFGRVCKENGNDGTDHGHGGPMWLLGGKVQGGKVFGKWTGLDPKELYERRDLPVTTDFREVFADVLYSHMGFEPPADFFPKYRVSSEGTGLFA